MRKENVLVIEDESDIQELVRYNLVKEGYDVTVAGSGEEGIKAVKDFNPDLVLLDLMLPGMDGLSVCRELKSKKDAKNPAVVIVSAKGEESDVVSGLELGADDYVTKPFSPKILLARVKAVLRRKTEKPLKESDLLVAHDLTIDPGRFEVRAKDSVIVLTLTEFRILHFLARHPGWVFTRYQIVDAVKGEDYSVTDRAVDVQIVGLRRKLGDYGMYVETVRGIGYRFKE